MPARALCPTLSLHNSTLFSASGPGTTGCSRLSRNAVSDSVTAPTIIAHAASTDIDEAKVGSLEVDVTPPTTLVELLKRLQDLVATANEATDAVAAARREAAQLLREEGLPIRDAGELIGVSHQRVSQILG